MGAPENFFEFSLPASAKHPQVEDHDLSSQSNLPARIPEPTYLDDSRRQLKGVKAHVSSFLCQPSPSPAGSFTGRRRNRSQARMIFGSP